MMTIQNRRLREIRKEQTYYQKLLDEASTISECLLYTGKLECLENEEEKILKRYDVII